MKIYVKEIKERTVDGDYITVVKTYESQPKGKYYIVWR